MLGSLPVTGAFITPQQVDTLFPASHIPDATSPVALDASPASPRLFGQTALPQTPPSQLLRAVSSPPPVRRQRSIASPPLASHPILSSAITVACTIAPDANRLPTQRQLAFPIQNTPPAQHASPFAAAATVLEPPSLLDKINSLPGPQQLLRSVLTENKASLSLQDSGMLTHMLHRATLVPNGSNDGAVASSSAGSACSLPIAPEDAASPTRAKRSRPSPLKAPAPPVSKFCMDPAKVNTLLDSSRSAFNKTAFKPKAYASKSQETASGTQTPSPKSEGSPQGGLKGDSMNSQGRTVVQHAASMLLWAPADSLFRYASAGPDSRQPALVYPGICSTMAITHCAPKGNPLSATARPGSFAKPFCSFSDYFDFRNKGGKVDANNQAVKATQYSPWGQVSWNPTSSSVQFGDLSGSLDGTDHILNPSVSRPGHFLEAPLTGPLPQATQSRSSNYQTGQDLLTVPTDIRGANTCTTHSEKLRPASTGFLNLAQTTDRGRAGLSAVSSSGAPNKATWPSPQSTAKHRPVADGFASHAGLECRLMLPHGTRGHKRPRLEDKLKEQRMLRADFGKRVHPGRIQ